MSLKTAVPIVAACSMILAIAGCDCSGSGSRESTTSGRQSPELSTEEISTESLDAELFAASLAFTDLALAESKQQLAWLEGILSRDARRLGKEFRNRIEIWTSTWDSMNTTYDEHPVTWDREALAKTIAMSSVTFGDLMLSSSLLFRYFEVPGFLDVATGLNAVRIDWLKLESGLLEEWTQQGQVVLRRFPEVEDLDLLTTGADRFSEWLRELDSSQGLLTRLAATPAQEDRIYAERKGRQARLRDDIIPFWRELARVGLQPDSEKTAGLILALSQLTDDYAEARLNLGRYLQRQPGFSFEYSLVIQWGLNDLFCRSVYMALLSDNMAWMVMATRILEVQLVSSDAFLDLLKDFGG